MFTITKASAISPFYPKFFEKIPLLSAKGCSINLYQENYKFSGRVEQVGTEASVFSMGLTSYLEFAYGNLFFAFFPFLSRALSSFIQ
jgi:hypothetical protein